DARCALTIELAEGHIAELGELEDAAFGIHVAVDAAGAPEDVLGAKARVEHIEMMHAIEDRENRGLRADGGGEILDCGFQRVGLDREEDEVERLRLCAELIDGDELRLDGGVAERADDLQTGAAKLLRTCGAYEEGDVAANL